MQSPQPGPPVVLIAERDQHVRRLQSHFLENAGFAVEFADDGEIAFQRARDLLPAVIVTEILIPRIDGLALCRLVRAEPLTSRIPILVFSILTAAERAAEAGADAFLRKPLVDSTFLATVRDLVATQPAAELEGQWASK